MASEKCYRHKIRNCGQPPRLSDGKPPGNNWAHTKECDINSKPPPHSCTCVGELARWEAIIQLAAANAIIDKLPVTADGVPVVHGIGTCVWTWTVRAGICRPREGKVLCEFRVDFLASAHDKAITDDPRWGGFVLGSHTALIPTKDCYSTRKAAAAAQEPGQ